MPGLGVNIDHVATLQQARGRREPNPSRLPSKPHPTITN